MLLLFGRSCKTFTPAPSARGGQQGFTLIEIMVVIVILSIFAGMMSLSVGGSENRRNTAFYERLTSNLNYVRLLSTERMQPYGLAIKLPQNDTPNQLVVVKLENAFTNSQSAVRNANTAITSQPAPPQWVIEKQIPPLDVPDNLDVKIRPLDNPFNTTAQNTQLTASWSSSSEAPPVVWFGTGEATPVQISIQKTNADKQTFAVGNPIIVNQAGAIEVAK